MKYSEPKAVCAAQKHLKDRHKLQCESAHADQSSHQEAE